MIPKQQDFKDAYQNDGLKRKVLRFRRADQSIINLFTSTVKLSMVDINNRVAWTFSSAGDGNTLITFDTDGSIIIPEIKEWAIKPGAYRYDMQVKDASGFVSTYIAGKWNVKPDITKIT